MRFSKALSAIVLCMFGCAAPSAFAQSCAGFTDVSLFNSFCTNVTWMKNRQITLGCTPTTYCPDLAVVRLAMAAFMRRVGDVVTPTVLQTEESGTSLNILAGTQFVCQTPELASALYPRTVLADGSLSFDVPANQGVFVGVALSRNGGPWQGLSGLMSSEATSGERHHHHAMSDTTFLFDGPSVTFRYALLVARTDPGFNAIGAWTCQLQVQAINVAQ